MEFRILGPIEVLRQDQQVPLGGAKQKSLLAVLLLHANQTVSTDRLIDDLWGEEPPETARNILQVYVSQLRKVLRPAGARESDGQVITTRGLGYVIQVGQDELDALRFERLSEEGEQALSRREIAVASANLREALGVWRGPALADFEFDDFAQAEIERLNELRLVTLENRIEADLGLGRHGMLVGELETLIHTEPMRERFRGQLMLALYRSGRQAEALGVYRDGLQILQNDLGIDPSPSLQHLHESILRQDSALDLPSTASSGESGTLVPEITARPVRAQTLSPLRAEQQGTLDEEAAMPSVEEILPVTVLFADIVGSTPLAETLMLEEVRAVIGECVGRMTRAVEEFGGSIQAYQGDGICAYFGVSTSHEDDPQRAALAALRILEVVREHAREIEQAWGIKSFDVRVGVNSGRALIGLIGAADPQQVAFGEPSFVAARLEQTASPGTIVVGEDVAERLREGFDLETLGGVQLKGLTEEVNAWRLVGASEAPPLPLGSPLVGRDQELRRLEGCVQDLRAGRGQVLLIGGEAGIGKTRMLSELRALSGGSGVWLEGRCQSHGGRILYRPFVEILRGWIGAREGEPDIVIRTKLRSRLDTELPDAAEELVQPLGKLLSVRMGEPEDELTDLPPDELAATIMAAFRRWIGALCDRGPVVVAIQDLHAADPSTCDLAEGLLDLTDRAPLLIAANGRLDVGTKGWRFWIRARTEFAHRTVEMNLQRLDDGAASELTDALTPTGNLDEATRAEVVRRAEGNPFYLEELLRVLIAGAGLQRSGSWTLTMTRQGLTLPPALEGLLVVRIQRLPPEARRLAQAAAVIGKEFIVRLLERVAGRETVEEHLSTLLRAEVVRELCRYPELTCVFHHGLLQQAALSTLTPSAGKELYGRVGEAIEDLCSASIEENLDRLAFYFYRSDKPAKALSYLERAATRALRLDAAPRAEELWSRARRVAVRIGDEEAQARIAESLGTVVTEAP